MKGIIIKELKFLVRTLDHLSLIVFPLLINLQTSPEGCVAEIQGRVNNAQGSEVNATTEPIFFSREASEKFDTELYSQAVQMTAQYDRFYIQPMEG